MGSWNTPDKFGPPLLRLPEIFTRRLDSLSMGPACDHVQHGAVPPRRFADHGHKIAVI